MFGWLSSLAGVQNISPADARRRVDAGAVLVDVRETDEWRQSRIPGAVHMPLSSLDRRAAELPKDRPVILYCLSGGRSTRAARRCSQLGIVVEGHVAGGIIAWGRAGLPLER